MKESQSGYHISRRSDARYLTHRSMQRIQWDPLNKTTKWNKTFLFHVLVILLRDGFHALDLPAFRPPFPRLDDEGPSPSPALGIFRPRFLFLTLQDTKKLSKRKTPSVPCKIPKHARTCGLNLLGMCEEVFCFLLISLHSGCFTTLTGFVISRANTSINGYDIKYIQSVSWGLQITLASFETRLTFAFALWITWWLTRTYHLRLWHIGFNQDIKIVFLVLIYVIV